MTNQTNRRITLLGSTGSIGKSCLQVLAQIPDKFSVAYLTAHQNWRGLLTQTQEFKPRAVAITGLPADTTIERMFTQLGVPVFWGAEGLAEIAARTDTDLVVNALVGSVGLKPTLLAIEAGKNIALSNKETLVMAGALVLRLAREKQVSIIPVDSEHSAIFQCLLGEPVSGISRLIITASGGPFWQRSAATFAEITVAEALKHPNWNMGPKITIDSATLMNKGLEVIEAHWLFNLPPEKISVVLHPTSIVHSMVEFVDGAIKAQLGIPDMKIPIQYALSFPKRWENAVLPRLDFSSHLTLDFYPPDYKKFRPLQMAFDVLRAGGTAPAVLNAANEVAVQLFLDQKIRFTQIPEIIESALDHFPGNSNPALEDYLQADEWARKFAARD
jgi:1-deoxy-D-xylulose-5-phosphate reductoisomerase